MNYLLYVVLFVAAISGFFLSSYLFALAFYSIFIFKKNKIEESGTELKYCILIPAHDEELSILQTIQSCNELKYPEENIDVVVIADNCSDNTAAIARQAGAKCIERFDRSNLGKGWALSWAFQEVENKYDVYIVLDADCKIDCDALNQFSHYIEDGCKVLQANDVSGNPDDSFISYALSVGNYIENDLFYAPKSKTGLAVFLRGTGMVIHKDILEKFPWSSYSIAEDMEYSEQLILSGEKVTFVPEIKVTSNFPSTLDQLRIQRTRWASGNLGHRRFAALKILFNGLLKKDTVYIDAGLTLLTLSKPLIIVYLLTLFIVSGFLCLLIQNIVLKLIFLMCCSSLGLLMIYIGSAIVSMGLNKKRLGYLAKSPKVFFELIVVSVFGLFGVEKNNWKKTPR